MNILIIPTNDWTRAPGAGHINYIAEELAERGHTVYAWNFNLYKNQPVKRAPKKVKLIGSRTLPLQDPAVFFTLNAIIQGPAVFKAIRNLKIDVVINENVLCGLVAFLAAGNRVLKVFDFSDYFPESASVYYTGSSQVMKKLVEGVTLTITKLNVRFSNVCLAVCQSLIKTTAGIDKAKPCYLITNGVNTCSPREESEKSATENAASSMIVMGVIDDWLDLETPLKALKILTEKHPDLKLVVIGPWQKKEFRRRFEDQTKSMELDSQVEVTGYISSQKLHQYLNASSFCVMPYKLDTFYSAIRLPEKLFVYSAYGKPILSTPLPEVSALNSEHIFFYHNATELAVTAEAMLSDAAMREGLCLKAYAFARGHDFKILAENVDKILKQHLAKLRHA